MDFPQECRPHEVQVQRQSSAWRNWHPPMRMTVLHLSFFLSLSLLASSAEDNVLYCNGNETHKKNANDSSILFIDRIIWLYRYKEMPWRGESKRCLQGAKTKGYLYNPEGGSKGWAQQKTTREPLQRMRILACMNAKQLMHTHISLIWPWLTKWLITHAGSFPRSCAHHHWAELEHACETQQHNWILGHAWTLEACAELYNVWLLLSVSHGRLLYSMCWAEQSCKIIPCDVLCCVA